MLTRPRLLRLVAPLALTVVGALSAQQAVALPADLDNTLYEDAGGSFSNALGESVFVGVTAQNLRRRALLRFDVAGAVPSGARIVAATLDLHVVASGASQPAAAGLHRVLQTWGEGTSFALSGGGGMGAPSTAGDATWLHTFYPGATWASPGGDFVTAPSAQVSLPTIGATTNLLAADAVADLQAWLDQPATNFGWLLKAETETFAAARARRIDSRQSAANQPMLTVTWLLPGQSGAWGDGCGGFSFAFQGTVAGGATLTLQHGNGPAGQPAISFFALALDPVGTPLPPGCRVHLPAAGPWIPGFPLLLDASGAGAVAWTLPTIYPGLYFVGQAAALDASPFGFVTSDAALALLP